MDEIKLSGKCYRAQKNDLKGKNFFFKFLTLVVIWKCSPIGTNLPYNTKQSSAVQLVWLKENGGNS